MTRAMGPSRGHLVWHRARSPPTATRTAPAPQDQEGKTEPGTSSGAALKGPYTRPAWPAEPARSGRAPLPSRLPGFCPPRPRPTNTLGAEPGAGRRCGVWRSAGKGPGGPAAFCLCPGFGPSAQEAPLTLPSLPRPVRSPEPCFGPQSLLPKTDGTYGGRTGDTGLREDQTQ